MHTSEPSYQAPSSSLIPLNDSVSQQPAPDNETTMKIKTERKNNNHNITEGHYISTREDQAKRPNVPFIHYS